MKTQIPKNTVKSFVGTIIVGTITILLLITFFYLFLQREELPIMPDSVRREWLTEKSREDAVKEYYEQICRNLEIDFINKETVRIKWKTWEVDRVYFSTPYFYDRDSSRVIFYHGEGSIDTVRLYFRGNIRR